MLIAVKSLRGVGNIPSDRTWASKWLVRHGVPIHRQRGKGGAYEAVRLCDLPADVRLALLRRDLEALHLDPGTYDDDAHEVFMQASPSRRERAERKAQVAAVLVSLGKLVPWKERLQIIHARFGKKGHSKHRLRAILKAVEGVDPINYAPALLDGYKATAKQAEMSEEAWRFFLTTIRDAAPDFPLKAAWRDTRDVGVSLGWSVPSYPTFYRRWQAMSESERLHARHGRAVAQSRLVQPAHRNKSTMPPLAWVSLDGRVQDFWVDFGDSRPVRPVMLALVDVASDKVLGWELAPSENAAHTVRLIKGVCERHGIFDRLYTDNGSAFAGHLVAGGNVHRFRNGRKKVEGVQPPGICQIMGIKLTFALPTNAQAKIAERTFRTLSRAIDDRPEFKGCHAGHAPGATPTPDVTPVPLETALSVVQREINRHNREPGRRSQGARGRSYEQVFNDGLQGRIVRKPTARQLYLAGLIYSAVSVDRFGQVRKNGWIYGGPTTQQALLEYHGTGRKILLGRDPDDFSAPAIAFDEDGRLICEGIEPVQAGAYDSVDGIRNAARNRKAARAAVAAAETANNYLDDARFAEALAALGQDCPASDEHASPARKVVAGRFGAPLTDTPARKASGTEAIPAEFYRNMDTALAAKKPRSGGPA